MRLVLWVLSFTMACLLYVSICEAAVNCAKGVRWTPAKISDTTERARGGDAAQQLSLANYYYRISDMMCYDPGSDAEGDYWLARSASQDYPPALMEEGERGERNRGLTNQYASAWAFHWYERAAAVGYLPAEFELAEDLAVGRGTRLDPTRAADWYQRILATFASPTDIARQIEADQERFAAQCVGADHLDASDIGWLTPCDQRYTVELLRLAANEGSASAASSLAWYSEHGLTASEIVNTEIPRKNVVVIAPNQEEAMLWRRRAFELGDTEVAYDIADAYEWGIGVKRDFETAKFYFSRVGGGDAAYAACRLSVLKQRKRITDAQAKAAEQRCHPSP